MPSVFNSFHSFFDFVHVVVELNWRHGHDGRYRVFIDQLRMPVAPQQDAEIVEPRDDALKFDAVDQEHRYWDLVLSDVVEKGVLKILVFFR